MKVIFLLTVIIIIGGCSQKKAEVTGHEQKPLPSFDLLLIDSITYFNTKSIPLQKPAVLFYFGPNCPYSRAQMEEITNKMSHLKNINFYVLTTWPFQEMKSFYNDFKLKAYPNILVGQDTANYFVKFFAPKGVPYIAIYGKDKKLRNAFIGLVKGNIIKQIAEE